MHINDLPNELILNIFKQTPWSEDMISCSKVCHRWEALAFQRLSRIEYLLGVYEYNEDPTITEDNVMYYHHNIMQKGYLETLVQYVPNLRILEVIDAYKMEPEFLALLLQHGPPIKGLRYLRRIPGAIDYALDHLQMISTNCLTEPHETLIDTLQQVYVVYSIERTLEILSCFNCLKRVHIHDFVGGKISRIPSRKFEKLKILELGFKSSDRIERICLGSLINVCPNLKSLYIRLDRHQISDIDLPDITMFVEDVVLEYDESVLPDDPIPPILESFPNLKNLALRRNSGLTDYEVREILSNWTQLSTLDVRGSVNVTHHAEMIVQKFSQNYSREIKFFWGEYCLSRPSVREALICTGFDFMSNVFHRQFSQVPSFLDEVD